MQNNGSALEAVTVATMVLEDSPLTNAGYGSNLTWNGCVECDAGIMDGSTMNFGGVGAVSGIKNPISLARLICEKQHFKMSLGRIPPWYTMFLLNTKRILLLFFFIINTVSFLSLFIHYTYIKI